MEAFPSFINAFFFCLIVLTSVLWTYKISFSFTVFPCQRQEKVVCRAIACLMYEVYFSGFLLCIPSLSLQVVFPSFEGFVLKQNTHMIPTFSQFMYIFHMVSLSYLTPCLCLGYGCEQVPGFYQSNALVPGRASCPKFHSVSCIFSIKFCSTTN